MIIGKEKLIDLIENWKWNEAKAEIDKIYEHLSTIVQQSLSSSPKSPQDIVFGGWHLCPECRKPVTNGKKCKNCGDFAEECKNEKCEFYNEKFDMNCDANEDFCEKCNCGFYKRECLQELCSRSNDWKNCKDAVRKEQKWKK